MAYQLIKRSFCKALQKRYRSIYDSMGGKSRHFSSGVKQNKIKRCQISHMSEIFKSLILTEKENPNLLWIITIERIYHLNSPCYFIHSFDIVTFP